MKNLIVTVVGMGLIGGSIARSLSKNFDTIYGIDLDETVISCAENEGIITKGFTKAVEVLPKSDIVILALYPDASLRFMVDNVSIFKKGCIVTDVVGIKTPLMDWYISQENPSFTYIGGHPMAGKEVSGFFNSTDTMFSGANFIITAPDNATQGQIEIVERIAKLIGCKTITHTTPQNHDKIIAYTSQLPHVIATAMCDTPLLVQHKHFTGGSFEDVTRVANINENLWTELFIHNAEYLTEEIDRFMVSLSDIKSAIEAGDESKLREIMRRVRISKEMIDNS